MICEYEGQFNFCTMKQGCFAAGVISSKFRLQCTFMDAVVLILGTFWSRYILISAKVSFKLGFTCKRNRNKVGIEGKNSWTLPYHEMMVVSSLVSNEMQLHPLFTLYTTKWTRDASAFRWRRERRAPSFRSKVVLVFLSLIMHALFLSFYWSSPNLKWIFSETFPYFCTSLGEGDSKPTFKQKTKVYIAIVCSRWEVRLHKILVSNFSLGRVETWGHVIIRVVMK